MVSSLPSGQTAHQKGPLASCSPRGQWPCRACQRAPHSKPEGALHCLLHQDDKWTGGSEASLEKPSVCCTGLAGVQRCLCLKRRPSLKGLRFLLLCRKMLRHEILIGAFRQAVEGELSPFSPAAGTALAQRSLGGQAKERCQKQGEQFQIAEANRGLLESRRAHQAPERSRSCTASVPQIQRSKQQPFIAPLLLFETIVATSSTQHYFAQTGRAAAQGRQVSPPSPPTSQEVPRAPFLQGEAEKQRLPGPAPL